MNSIFRILIRQSVMDFRKRNLGTFLGCAWAVISPLMTIGLIYFVFSFGLKTSVMGKVSFINWLVPGMLAWFFFNEAMMGGCTSITDCGYLVTKIIFPVQVLPVSRILSYIPVHMGMMLAFMLLLIFEGTGTPRSWWQLAYYLICAFILCTSLSFITSSCMVFIRDTANAVGVFMQLFFWATPIFWDPSIISKTRMDWILLTPFNYIIQGYRDSLFNGVYFWEKPLQTFVFWIITLIIIFLGVYLFKNTRPHFADVL